MTPKIRQLLASLYGPEAARRLVSPITALLARHLSARPASIQTARCPWLTERDALLITYGDQVREPGQRPLRSLAGFLAAHAQDLVSGLHVLPFYPSSSDDGFSVMDYFAVDPALGTWDDIARLGSAYELMFDAVFNHVSAQGEWFERFRRDDPRFRDFFITVQGEPDLSQVARPRALPLVSAFESARGEQRLWTTFSVDQVDLNFRNPRVLLAVLEVLLFYVRKGARFIRLDAIAYLWKEIGTPCIHLPQTHRIVQLFRAVLEAVAPAVLLVTETNVPHAENLSYFGDGTNEAQLVYNFALPPLVLHALQTGNATALNRWAAALRLPSERVSCLNFLASHDGIGLNPARGLLRAAEIQALVAGTLAHGGLVSYKDNPDGTQSPYELNTTYFDALSDPRAAEPLDTQIDRFMVAHAIMLAFIGVPGIYLPSLVGARNDRAGAEASGMARRINRRKFSRSELETQLADPASMAARVLARFRELLGARRSHAAFHPQGQQQVLDCGPHVVALWRTSPTREEQVLCLHNVAAHPVEVGISDRPVPPGAQWVDVLHEGGGTALGDRGLRLVVPAYGIRWMKLVSRSR